MRKPTKHHLDQLAFIRNKPVSMVCVTINGVETAAIAHVTKAEDGTFDIEPIAILCNEGIFNMIEPPNPEDKVIMESDGPT